VDFFSVHFEGTTPEIGINARRYTICGGLKPLGLCPYGRIPPCVPPARRSKKERSGDRASHISVQPRIN
jgi:hypothetical protein